MVGVEMKSYDQRYEIDGVLMDGRGVINTAVHLGSRSRTVHGAICYMIRRGYKVEKANPQE